jgi:hypothetical protein
MGIISYICYYYLPVLNKINILPMIKVPIQIRPHLIPFLYYDFKNISDDSFDKISTKSCEIKKDTAIGKIVLAILENQDCINVNKKLYIYFSVPKNINKASCAHIYQIKKNKEELVKVPEKIAKDLNYIFQDFFLFAFVNSIKNIKKYAPHEKVKDLILDFMNKYNLDEYGFRLDSLRRLYDRDVKNDQLLFRFNTKCSNRVLNFSS